MQVLKLDNVKKYYGVNTNITKAVDGVSFDINESEFVAIMGASGSGKTTLLNCISTIDNVTSGNIFVGDENITKIKEEFINNVINSKEFVYVYLIIGDINTSKITLQKEEVSDFLWTTKEELNKLIENKVIINHKEEFELINEIIK